MATTATNCDSHHGCQVSVVRSLSCELVLIIVGTAHRMIAPKTTLKISTSSLYFLTSYDYHRQTDRQTDRHALYSIDIQIHGKA
jgi:hypothetical protein